MAVYVIVVVPTGKMFPAGTPLRATVAAPAQLSVAIAAPSAASLTTRPHAAPGPVATVTLAGAVSTGGLVSRTVTVRVAVVVLPAASVAV